MSAHEPSVATGAIRSLAFASPAKIKAAWLFAHRWKGRIFYAIGDQGCASAAHFLLTILYAAWLPLDGFGRYVVVWTISILVESFQLALIMDSLPAIVSQHGRFSRQRVEDAGIYVVVSYGVGTSVLILAAALAATFLAPYFVVPLLCLALVNSFQRLYIYFRRFCYIRDRQDVAAVASVTYGLTLVAGALVLRALDVLTVPAAVLLWGAANGAAIVVICLRGIGRLPTARPATVLWLAKRLWRSGRWLAGSAVGYWVTSWGIFPIVAGLAGLETAGILRALQNLFTPIIQFNAALNLALLPRVADRVVSTGAPFARSFAIYGTAAFTAVVFVYSALVLGSAGTLLPLVYSKPEIAAASYLLWPLAIAMMFESSRQASSTALLAVGRTRAFFVARFAGIAVLFGAAALLGRSMGFEGVLWANVLAHAVATAILVAEALSISSAKARCSRFKPTAVVDSRAGSESFPGLS